MESSIKLIQSYLSKGDVRFKEMLVPNFFCWFLVFCAYFQEEFANLDVIKSTLLVIAFSMVTTKILYKFLNMYFSRSIQDIYKFTEYMTVCIAVIFLGMGAFMGFSKTSGMFSSLSFLLGILICVYLEYRKKDVTVAKMETRHKP